MTFIHTTHVGSLPRTAELAAMTPAEDLADLPERSWPCCASADIAAKRL